MYDKALLIVVALHASVPAALAAPEIDASSEHAFSCFIQPSREVALGAPAAGIVAEVHVERAQSVAEGDVLLRLESSMERANLALAEAAADFTGEIRAAEAQLANLRRRHERAREMQRQGAVPTEVLEQAETQALVAAGELAKARQNQRLARLERDRARSMLALREVRAPFDGIITDRLVAAGEFVRDQPVLKIARIRPLHVELVLPVETMGRYAVGDPVSVLAEQPAQRHMASVLVVDRVIDAASGTYRVTLELDNPDGVIAGGQRCHLAGENLADR